MNRKRWETKSFRPLASTRRGPAVKTTKKSESRPYMTSSLWIAEISTLLVVMEILLESRPQTGVAENCVQLMQTVDLLHGGDYQPFWFRRMICFLIHESRQLSLRTPLSLSFPKSCSE
jgi:hypothetical protein